MPFKATVWLLFRCGITLPYLPYCMAKDDNTMRDTDKAKIIPLLEKE